MCASSCSGLHAECRSGWMLGQPNATLAWFETRCQTEAGAWILRQTAVECRSVCSARRRQGTAARAGQAGRQAGRQRMEPKGRVGAVPESTAR